MYFSSICVTYFTVNNISIIVNIFLSSFSFLFSFYSIISNILLSIFVFSSSRYDRYCLEKEKKKNGRWTIFLKALYMYFFYFLTASFICNFLWQAIVLNPQGIHDFFFFPLLLLFVINHCMIFISHIREFERNVKFIEMKW